MPPGLIELFTAIALAIAAELLRRKRNRYIRERSDPPPELNSDPDATDPDLPESYRSRRRRAGRNPRTNHHR